MNNIKIFELDETYLNLLVEIDHNSNQSPWSVGNYQSSFANNHHYVFGLFINEILQGFCIFSLILDEAEILLIVINTICQANGYGTILLDNIIKIIAKQQARQIFLEVNQDNQPAITLYNKFNFTTVGLRKNYYMINNQSYNALIMCKTDLSSRNLL